MLALAALPENWLLPLALIYPNPKSSSQINFIFLVFFILIFLFSYSPLSLTPFHVSHSSAL